MSAVIDRWLPWLADLLELGGPVLSAILIIAFVMWLLIFERVHYLLSEFPRELARAEQRWRRRRERTSWFAEQDRMALTGYLGARLHRNFDFIATLIKVCPLLGLLGTVIGMLEVFDALAATGSNNPRSMAAGVSKATVSTLAGMVVAIVGLLAHSLSQRRADAIRGGLEARFTQFEDRDRA